MIPSDRDELARKSLRLVGRQLLSRVAFKLVALSLMAGVFLNVPAIAQGVRKHKNWPGPGQLYVGTCYQPIERTPKEIDEDIALMKKAGFDVVRMGDLSWDSFEPEQGKFEFDWWDKIIAKMQAAGIKVILDIPGTPAPIWLHRKYPGVDIVNQYGSRRPPTERYMDDISDPNYIRKVGILATAMMKHYAHNPDIVAIGYDNEIGKGYAIYLATWSKASSIGPLLTSLFKRTDIRPGPKAPKGVYARVVDGRTFYVNTTSKEQVIPIKGTKTGIISHRRYRDEVVLGP